MTIRCALLLVSTEDEPIADETVDGVRLLLRRSWPGLFIIEERQVGSDRHLIAELLRRWCDEEEMDLVLTIGGTFPAPGHSGEQITPEATGDVVERGMPSLPETMRIYAAEDHPDALLDRGVAGIRARTLLLNLPGEGGLTHPFLSSVVDVLAAILARLRPLAESAVVESYGEPSAAAKPTGLDKDEFAAFLASRRSE